MKKAILTVILLAFAALCAPRAQAQVIVIANTSVNADSVSKAELRDVYNGVSTSLKNGARVRPVILKDGPTHNQFLMDYLGKNSVTFVIAWRGLVLSGQATMPKSIDSEPAMVDYVAKTPGAIGYVSKATAHDSVKELAVH